MAMGHNGIVAHGTCPNTGIRSAVSEALHQFRCVLHRDSDPMQRDRQIDRNGHELRTLMIDTV